MENKDIFQQRYKHHIALGGFGILGQQALLNAKVLVVGTKETSMAALMHLAAMGVGCLGIVELSSTPLSFPLSSLFSYNDLGKSIVYTMAQRLREVNPDIQTEIHDTYLNVDNALAIMARYDIVIHAPDNSEGALLVNDACVICGKPIVFGWAQKFEGRVCVFNYKGGATYRCLLSTPDTGIENNQEPGVLGLLPGLTGTYMASEAVKMISGLGEVLSGKVLHFNWLTNSQQIIPITVRKENFTITTLHPQEYQLPEDTPASQGLSVTPHQLFLKISYQESLQLIDIREYDQQTHAPLDNALHIPRIDLLNHLDKIHQDVPVILISNDGQEGKQLSSLLNEKYGFGNIYYLEGGVEALSS